MDGVAQDDVLIALAFDRKFLSVGVELLPRSAITILGRIGGIDGFDIQILLVDPDDGQSERDVFVVPDRDARQRGFAGADGVPTRPDQMNGLA